MTVHRASDRLSAHRATNVYSRTIYLVWEHKTKLIAHRIPSRSASNRPNAIVCKFTRRLAKGKVLAARRRLENLEASQLGLPADFDIGHINLYDHLTSRLQELLFESKKYKNANNFKFCWAKNGAVCLRKTETSTVIKLTSLDKLNELRESR